MTSPKYIFKDAEIKKEFERLRNLEVAMDPTTKQRLQKITLPPDANALEVGPGAGSILRYIAQEVLPKGKVLGIDLNPRFLQSLEIPNITIKQADIQEIDLPKNTYDLIHTRYVFIHLPKAQETLQKLYEALKPGGWLVLEEPDFTEARPIVGSDIHQEAFYRFKEANQAMFAQMGTDWSIGVKIPLWLQQYSWEKISWEMNTHLSQGSDAVAKVINMSVEYLRQRFINTGKITDQEIDRYLEFTTNKHQWAIYYATVCTWMKK